MLSRTRSGVMGASRVLACWLGLAAAAVAQSQSTSPAKPLLLVTAPYPPFVHAGGNPQGEGMDIDIAREALQRGGYDIEVQLVPWKRALLMLERGDADFTTTISRSGDRDRFIDWSQGYRSWVRYHFYARSDATDTLNDLDDLHERTLGVTLGYFYPDAIVKPLKPGLRIESGKDLATTIRMLRAGRSDFIVVNALAGAWEIKQLGLMDDLKLQPLVYSSDSPTYMGFSKVRNNMRAVDAMNKGLNSMLKDGTIAKIERRYMQ